MVLEGHLVQQAHNEVATNASDPATNAASLILVRWSRSGFGLGQRSGHKQENKHTKEEMAIAHCVSHPLLATATMGGEQKTNNNNMLQSLSLVQIIQLNLDKTAYWLPLISADIHLRPHILTIQAVDHHHLMAIKWRRSRLCKVS